MLRLLLYIIAFIILHIIFPFTNNPPFPLNLLLGPLTFILQHFFLHFPFLSFNFLLLFESLNLGLCLFLNVQPVLFIVDLVGWLDLLVCWGEEKFVDGSLLESFLRRFFCQSG